MTAVGVIMILLGGEAGAGSHFLDHAWMPPVAKALVTAGFIELVLGSLLALAFRRLVGERLRLKVKESIRWADEQGGSCKTILHG